MMMPGGTGWAQSSTAELRAIRKRKLAGSRNSASIDTRYGSVITRSLPQQSTA
jgi:hypothetical protein